MTPETEGILRKLFDRCDHCDGTVVCEDRESYRYQVRAFREFNPEAPDGSWGVYDYIEKRFVDPEDVSGIDADERLPLN